MEEKNDKRTSAKDGSVRNIRSGLFAYVFSREKALVDLYRGLGKEIKEEDIKYLSLSEQLQKTGRYNDTAFHTKDNRLIVFVEHQSTKNRNMPFRFLEYAVYAMKVLNVFAGQNRFGEKLMDFPKIELYVAYNGKKALKEEDKTLVVDLCDIRVAAKVVDIRFDCLPREKAEDTQDALAGYAYFTKVFGEMKAKGETPHQAFTIAVKNSVEKGYLAEIWSRKECVDMFAETYCYDEQLRDEGFEQGIEKIAKNMLRLGRSIDEISEVTGLSVAQIAELQDEMFVK